MWEKANHHRAVGRQQGHDSDQGQDTWACRYSHVYCLFEKLGFGLIRGAGWYLHRLHIKHLECLLGQDALERRHQP